MDPTTVTVVVLVVVLVVLLLVVVAVVAAVVRRRKERERRARLQERFGGEYDRAVAGGDTRSAEARLAQAERDRERLQIAPLSAESRRRRTAQWQAVQADFVEVPVEAVDAAAGLVREVMTERGYPDDDNEHAITLLAADHADTVEHYRTAEAHRTRFRSGEGSTEDLRRAFVEYRRLFDVLVEEGADRLDPSDDSSLVDGSTRPDGSPMTADDYVRQQQGGRSTAAAASTVGDRDGLRDDRDGLRDSDRDGMRDDRDGLRDSDRDGMRDGLGGDRGEDRPLDRDRGDDQHAEHRADVEPRDDAASQDRTLGDRLDRLRREEQEGLDRDRPTGQHAARHEIDVRDERDPAPAPTPVGDTGATRSNDRG